MTSLAFIKETSAHWLAIVTSGSELIKEPALRRHSLRLHAHAVRCTCTYYRSRSGWQRCSWSLVVGTPKRGNKTEASTPAVQCVCRLRCVVYRPVMRVADLLLRDLCFSTSTQLQTALIWRCRRWDGVHGSRSTHDGPVIYCTCSTTWSRLKWEHIVIYLQEILINLQMSDATRKLKI